MPSVSTETQELPAAAGEQEEEEEWDEVVGALHERRAQKREVQQLRRANKMLQHQVAQLRQSVSVTAAPHDVRCLCQRRSSRGHIEVYSAVTLQVADLRALTADGGVGAAEQTMAELRSSLQAAEATAAEQRELLLTAQAEEAVADDRENTARNTVSALNEEVILLRSQLTETSRTTGSMQQEKVSRHPRQ